MNERIKELMDKAMVKTADMSRPGRKELDAEKLAELIVEECASYIKSMHNGNFYVIANELTKHFGVE